MKKTLLSLSALFAVSIASAQSYISQPDPSTYEVRKYQVPQKAGESVSDKAEATPKAKPAAEIKPALQETKTATETAATGTAKNAANQLMAEDKKVAQNRKK